jgi:GT2 family glycosyltransferase
MGTTGVTVVGDGSNVGFSAGCNVGAEAARGDYLTLINGDAIVEPGTIARLVEELNDPTVGIAAAAVRMAQSPELLNSRGNVVHVLGLSWVGGLGEPETRTGPTDVAGAMAAGVVMRRAHWDRLGGFDPHYFAYHEDAEISIRTWRMGLRVVNVPDAVIHHHYEFSRNPVKFYLSERNRLLFVSTLWSARALVLLAPPLVALELAMCAYAAMNRQLGAKLRGWTWLWQHRRHIAQRRRRLRAERVVPEQAWMGRLDTRVDSPLIPIPGVILAPLNVLTTGYWAAVRRLL